MTARRVLTFLSAVLLVTTATTTRGYAQGGRAGTGANEDTGAPSIRLGEVPTPFEQMADKLKLDGSQRRSAEQVFSDAAKDAAPVGQQMLDLRERLLNLELQSKSSDEMKPVLDSYSASAAKMTSFEVRAFQTVYATLKPDQQSKAAQAFASVAGVFQPTSPRRGGTRGGRGAALYAAAPIAAFAQRGGRGGGGGGLGGGAPVTRMETLEALFKFTKDQTKTIKTALDGAQKNAAPIRDALTRTRAAIAAAIQAKKIPPEIDAAVGAYAQQAASMTAVEMKALAQMIQALDQDQRANSAGLQSAFFLARGMFLDNKHWDDIPDGRSY